MSGDNRELPKLKTVARGLIIALSISVIAILVILFYTIDRSTWDALSKINPLCLVLAFGIMFGKWAANIYRTWILTRAAGARIRYVDAAKVVFTGTFTGAATPFHAAGIPTEIFFMTVYDIPAAQSTAIITTGTVMSVTLFVIMAPVVLLVAGAKVNAHVGLKTILLGAGIVALLWLLLVVYSMRDPGKMANTIIKRAPGRLKKKEWFTRGVKRFFEAVAHFSESLHTILNYRRSYLVIAWIMTLILWGAILFITPVILWGLGYPELFWKAFLAQLVVSYLQPFMPVPGESGLAEATFAGVFSVFVSKNLVGLLALMWRFFTFYLALIVSSIAFLFALRDSNRKLKRKTVPDHVLHSGTRAGN